MSKKSNRMGKFKKAVLVAGAAAAVGGAGWLGVTFGRGRPIFAPAYRAVRVIDGDTFETKEQQRIRFVTFDAPELDLCGGQEAKKELEELLLGKDIYLKVVRNITGRLLAIVYTKDGFVDEKMLESGWVILHNLEGLGEVQLTAANQKARKEKRGVYSELCTQTINYKNPDCKIKGNVRSADEKIYHFPGCRSYDTALIELHHGDQWFCSEAEAKKAGFVKAENCPGKY